MIKGFASLGVFSLGMTGSLANLFSIPLAQALTAESPPLENAGVLNGEQSDRFRAWMSLIVADQIRRGPSPRWYHRDCAGLARFAVAETLQKHDERWRRINGFEGKNLPPELDLQAEQAAKLKGWTNLDGDRQAFVTALALIQKNTFPIGRESVHARPGDLIFFDQGDDQHLMIWMGSWIAYHTGEAPPAPNKSQQKTYPEDNGLRAVRPTQLIEWKDTRWRLRESNPNFAGFYRLAFLSR